VALAGVALARLILAIYMLWRVLEHLSALALAMPTIMRSRISSRSNWAMGAEHVEH
jgi:hypothetical protein